MHLLTLLTPHRPKTQFFRSFKWIAERQGLAASSWITGATLDVTGGRVMS